MSRPIDLQYCTRRVYNGAMTTPTTFTDEDFAGLADTDPDPWGWNAEADEADDEADDNGWIDGWHGF